MILSTPLFVLRRQARLLAREQRIPLHQALDEIAREQGFSSWSLLMAKRSSPVPGAVLNAKLNPGDFVLVGARPGQGKTLLCLEMAVAAMQAGNRSVFFSLEYNKQDMWASFAAIGEQAEAFAQTFTFDASDQLSAAYIIEQLAEAVPGTFVVVDYLQLLDQKREHPPLIEQIGLLKRFVSERSLVMLFICQIDRSYDLSDKNLPSIENVRLPNPLDLTLFTKTCFLHEGKVRLGVQSNR
ncbi:MAG: DNA helicase [Pseudomonadaceae bacterium]|nr:DNA helicase [Pseudomonadaceae bacterium]